MEGINGTSRFLEKIWRLYTDTWEQAGNQPQTKDDELERKMHQTIRGVTERIETFRLNTMVSTLMEFVNTLGDRQRERTWKTSTYRQALETLMVILAPAAPHIVEELWQLTGHEGSVHQQAWPSWDAELAREEVIQVPVQVNGKLRDRVVVPADASEEDIKSAALASEAVQKFLDGKPPKKVIVAQKKLVNIVV
jgi:leucyl-tRNA synthetase